MNEIYITYLFTSKPNGKEIRVTCEKSDCENHNWDKGCTIENKKLIITLTPNKSYSHFPVECSEYKKRN